jgi:hypothetical protein
MYFLCWRLRWVPQSREVLEKRLRVLSCVCQTIEMLPENYTISLEVDLNELMSDASNEASRFIDENMGGKSKYSFTFELNLLDCLVDKVNKLFSLKNVSKKTLDDEYLILEARLALLNSGDFPNGPPVSANDIYEETISHRLYDMTFVVQRYVFTAQALLLRFLCLDTLTWIFLDCLMR